MSAPNLRRKSPRIHCTVVPRCSFARILLVVFLFFAGPRSSAAKDQSIESAAAALAKAAADGGQSTIVVFNFIHPRDPSIVVGENLARNFAAALAKAAPGLTVVSPADAQAFLDKNAFGPIAIQDAETAVWMAQSMKVTAAVFATYESKKGQAVGHLIDVRASPKSRKDTFKFSVPLTSDLQKEVPLTREKTVLGEIQAFPAAGEKGYGSPSCLACSHAPYTQLGTELKLEGTILLFAVVRGDGKVYEIAVMKALPAGLTESAINAVKGWTFKPATGPDGKPAAVRQLIEVTFHLY